ncbi:MAG: sugar ABC transporter substrate-binding protein [Rhodobacteraceae bacterium]|nr:sugar ABC transporter substrate-binding protein [Paracoccaceae bacterium]MCY4251559.1 sugar ABC transporter substrate-binding protein [Paracoccaceae bacterium]
MMKKLTLILSTLALITGLSSVRAETIEHNLLPGKPFGGTTINILSVVTPQFDGLMLRDEEFTELTGIETEWTFIPFANLQEKLVAEGLAAVGTYDVVNYLDSWGPANAHWLVRIDDLMVRDGISMDRYPDAFARSAQFEGETLGFPLRAHPQLMFYRKDLIPNPPTSWAEVVEIGKQLKETNPGISPLALYYNNDGNRQNLFIWLNFIWAAGGDIFNDDWTAAWTSEEALQATEDYIALHTVHEVTNPNSLSFVEQDARQSFMQGNSAMIPVWWWAYSGFYNPDASTLSKNQVAFAGMPSYEGRTKTYAISMPFSISSYSDNQAAAWEFMKWLSNPDMDKANAVEREVMGTKIVNNVVTHISSLTDPEVNAANDGIQAAAWDSLKESDIMPQIPEWPEVGDILSAAIAKAAAGGNVRELMIEAAEQSDRVLRRSGRIQ